MHIGLSSQGIKEIFSSFQGAASRFITGPQKKIIIVATIAFGALAISYLIRRCCFSASVIGKESAKLDDFSEDENDAIQSLPSPNNVTPKQEKNKVYIDTPLRKNLQQQLSKIEELIQKCN